MMAVILFHDTACNKRSACAPVSADERTVAEPEQKQLRRDVQPHLHFLAFMAFFAGAGAGAAALRAFIAFMAFIAFTIANAHEGGCGVWSGMALDKQLSEPPTCRGESMSDAVNTR